MGLMRPMAQCTFITQWSNPREKYMLQSCLPHRLVHSLDCFFMKGLQCSSMNLLPTGLVNLINLDNQ